MNRRERPRRQVRQRGPLRSVWRTSPASADYRLIRVLCAVIAGAASQESSGAARLLVDGLNL